MVPLYPSSSHTARSACHQPKVPGPAGTDQAAILGILGQGALPIKFLVLVPAKPMNTSYCGAFIQGITVNVLQIEETWWRGEQQRLN